MAVQTGQQRERGRAEQHRGNHYSDAKVAIAEQFQIRGEHNRNGAVDKSANAACRQKAHTV